METSEAGKSGIEEEDDDEDEPDVSEKEIAPPAERRIVSRPDSKAIADARARVLSRFAESTQADASFVFDDPEGTAWGKPVELFMRNKDGEMMRAKEIFGIPVDVKTVFGRNVGFDAKIGVVTVPADLKKEDIPLLAREFVRAWKNASEPNLTPPKDSSDKTLRKDYEIIAIQKEISKRRAFEEGLEKLRDEYTTWRLPKTRDKFKELEEAHAATVRDAEKAIDKFMPAIAAEYALETGQDLYKEAGGEDLFQDRLHDDMLVRQNNLVFKYDSKGKRHLFDNVADGIKDVHEIPWAAWGGSHAIVRALNRLETVQDLRIHRRMLPEVYEGELWMDKMLLALERAAHTPIGAVRTYGFKAATVALFIGFGLLTPAVWLLRGATELADKGLTGMMKSVGQWWLGKDYKPSKSLGELREEKEKEIEKAALSNQTKK